MVSFMTLQNSMDKRKEKKSIRHVCVGVDGCVSVCVCVLSVEVRERERGREGERERERETFKHLFNH